MAAEFMFAAGDANDNDQVKVSRLQIDGFSEFSKLLNGDVDKSTKVLCQHVILLHKKTTKKKKKENV